MFEGLYMYAKHYSYTAVILAFKNNCDATICGRLGYGKNETRPILVCLFDSTNRINRIRLIISCGQALIGIT